MMATGQMLIKHQQVAKMQISATAPQKLFHYEKNTHRQPVISI